MPGLKSMLSAFGMRKEPIDEDPRPIHRHQLLKRSNALLKKKKPRSTLLESPPDLGKDQYIARAASPDHRPALGGFDD